MVMLAILVLNALDFMDGFAITTITGCRVCTIEFCCKPIELVQIATDSNAPKTSFAWGQVSENVFHHVWGWSTRSGWF